MKRGDLVTFDNTCLSAYLMPVEFEEMRGNHGIVMSNVYEGQFSSFDLVTGKAYATEIVPVVDVMVAEKIIAEIPICYLRRVIANE